MSVDKVKAFFAKLEGDNALQAKVTALNQKARKDPKAAAADLVKIGAAAGFVFSADDYTKARAQRQTQVDVAGQGLPNDCPASWACTKVSNM